MDLILPVKSIYFNQIKDGSKNEEFRLCTPYWEKRLENKDFDRVIITLGYPKKEDDSKRLVFPWKGFSRRKIVHPFFGESEVEVYAIALTNDVWSQHQRK